MFTTDTRLNTGRPYAYSTPTAETRAGPPEIASANFIRIMPSSTRIQYRPLRSSGSGSKSLSHARSAPPALKFRGLLKSAHVKLNTTGPYAVATAAAAVVAAPA